MNINFKKPICGKLIIALFFICFVDGIASAEFVSCPGVSDYQALVDLYNATDGPNWTNQTGWADGAAGTDCDICNWHGVTCDENDRVIILSLYSNGLGGSLPTQFAGLSELEQLGLAINQITGTIPDALGNLSSLTSLTISNNQLSGTIPDAIGNLSNLENLTLSSNQLSGQIPSSIGNLSKLKTLRLTANDLSGAIPASIGNLAMLETLDLWSNDLSGDLPSTIYNLSNIIKIALNGNELTGQISSSIGNFTQVEEIRFQSNNFTGEIPSELGNLSSLTRLYLYQNDLEGCIPSTFQNLCSTDVRLFSNSCLSQNGNMTSFCAGAPCEDPSRVALMTLYNATGGDNWTNNAGWGDPSCSICGWYGVNCNSDGLMTSLILANNNLIGTLPDEIGDLTSLLSLHISSNDVTGNIPSSIGNLTSLETLILRSNSLTGPIPIELYNLINLTELSLAWNDLDGQIDPAIANLSLLEELRLEDNNLTGEIPSELGNLPNITRLHLYQNDLHGCIPSTFQNLCAANVNLAGNVCLKPNKGDFDSFCSGDPCQNSNRDDLMAIYNATGGDNWTNNGGWGDDNCGICSWYGVTCNSDGNPTDLRLSSNNLIGSLPIELGNLTSLENLRLNNNQLTGQIPPELFNLNNLIELYINRNALSGEISTSIANLTLLEELYLNSNNLTGEIPSEIANLSALTKLSLYQNQLEGCIPTSFQNLCSIQVNISGNPCLSHNSGNFNLFCAGDPCEGTGSFCSTCSDGILNGTETDIDCGGICEVCELDCSASPDFEALIALYNSANGPNWNLNSGWVQGAAGTDCDYCSWDGITCDANNRVTEIYLYQNNVIGPLPSEIGQLTELQRLYISESSLTGPIPSEIGNLTKLTQIVFFGNQLSGTIPASFSALTNLESLGLGYNQLTGEIPSFIGTYTGLKFLGLNGNSFEGAIPKSLGDLSNLEYLWLSQNNLSGCIPSSLQAFCGPGYSVHVSDNPCLSHDGNFNSFCGGQQCVLPSDASCDFSSCSNGVQDGAEGGVDCCGICPPCQIDCSSNPDFNALMAFYAATNGPAWGDYGWNGGAAGTDCDVCSWQGVTCNANGRVTELYFKSQNLSGQLPDELDQLTELISLKLEFNVLSGTIPASLGNLQHLQSLYLNGNNLIGEIPPSLSNLNQLQNLNLSHNQLSGCYDASLQQLCAQLSPGHTNQLISDGNNFDTTWESFCSNGVAACDCPTSFFVDGQLPSNHELISLISNDCPTRGTVHFNADPNGPCAGGDLFWMLSLTETPPVDINDDRIQSTTQDFMYLEAGTYYFYLIQRPAITLTDIVYLPPTTIVIEEVECFPCIDDVVIDEQTNTNLDGETIRSADYIEVSDVDIDQDLDTWAVDYFEITGPFQVEPNIEFSITIEDECECTIGSPCDDEDPCTINDIYDDDCACIGDMDPACVPDCTDGTDHGDPCNDGDACTENDVIDENCNCLGAEIPNCTTDCADGKNYGDPCDDGDACTENDEMDTNCNCVGVPISNCTSCPSGEVVGAACDDLDECTENDVWQIDDFGDCECVGVLIDENNNGECDFLEPCDEGEFLAKTLKSNECSTSQLLNVMVSEFSNGDTGVDEYIELYVNGKGTFDLRGLIVDDKEGGYQKGNGYSAGRIRFANHPNWANVKGGSIILIYNDINRNKNIAANDPTDKDSDNIFITPLSQPYFYGEELNAESKYTPIPPAWDLIWLYDKNDEINIRTCDEQLLQRISYGYEDTSKPTFGDVIQISKSVRKGLIYQDLMGSYTVEKTKASPGKYNNRKHKNFIKNGN